MHLCYNEGHEQQSNKVLGCVQTAKKGFENTSFMPQPCTLTIRVLALEVANEANIFLHPVKGSQLQSISYHLHGLLQQLGTDGKRREKYWGKFVTLARLVLICAGSWESALKLLYSRPTRTPPGC